jgi:hypothetical protein
MSILAAIRREQKKARKKLAKLQHQTEWFGGGCKSLGRFDLPISLPFTIRPTVFLLPRYMHNRIGPSAFLLLLSVREDVRYRPSTRKSGPSIRAPTSCRTWQEKDERAEGRTLCVTWLRFARCCARLSC